MFNLKLFFILLLSSGTDSRVGFGYRLGDHADFQVQFEIGPQKETKAIGTNTSNKRHVHPDEELKVQKEANSGEVQLEFIVLHVFVQCP
jgi:hypothetical protein